MKRAQLESIFKRFVIVDEPLLFYFFLCVVLSVRQDVWVLLRCTFFYVKETCTLTEEQTTMNMYDRKKSWNIIKKKIKTRSNDVGFDEEANIKSIQKQHKENTKIRTAVFRVKAKKSSSFSSPSSSDDVFTNLIQETNSLSLKLVTYSRAQCCVSVGTRPCLLLSHQQRFRNRKIV